MPEIGEIRTGKEVNKSRACRYIWCACAICNIPRWTQLRKGMPAHPKCHRCTFWKGGRIRRKEGYVLVSVAKDDFFAPMRNYQGYVFEHRLVMAKHLGRCLQRWELVHHKNHIKDDNKLENLQLVTDERHQQITVLENHIRRLENEIKELKARQSSPAHL